MNHHNIMAVFDKSAQHEAYQTKEEPLEVFDDDLMLTWSSGTDENIVKQEMVKGESEENESEFSDFDDEDRKDVNEMHDETDLKQSPMLADKGCSNHSDLTEQADKSEETFGNYCSFKCPTCKKLFKSWASIEAHWRNYSDCIWITSCECIVKRVDYVCKVCNEIVPNDLLLIKKHIIATHGMCIKKYSRVFNVESSYQKNAKKAQDLSKELMKQSTETTDLVGSLCVFACHECGIKLNSLGGLKMHEKSTKHKRSGSITQWALKITTHKCRVCNENFISDSHFIGKHLKRHKLKQKVYAKKYCLELGGPEESRKRRNENLMAMFKISDQVGDLCKYTCPKCESSFERLPRLIIHLKKTKHFNPLPRFDMETVHKFISTKVGHKCRVCNEKIPCDLTMVRIHVYDRHKIQSISDYCEKYSVSLVQAPLPDALKRRNEIVEHSELSDTIGNNCCFQCKVCQKKYHTWFTMEKHLKEAKHGASGAGREVIDRHIIKHVYYECKVCLRRIHCDSVILARHFRSYHRLPLHLYLEKFPQSRKAQIHYSEALDDLCEYECPECAAVFSSWVQITEHMKKTHQEIAKVSKRSLMTKHVVHKCKMCFKDVKCEIKSLWYHMRDAHKITLGEYARRTRLVPFRNGVLTTKYWQKREDFLRTIPYAAPQGSSRSMQETFPENMVTSSIGNLCTFRCYHCSIKTSFFSRQALSFFHLKTVHNKRRTQIHSRESLSEARYHRCLICSTIMLCDKANLNNHIKKIHKISWDNYEKMVKRNGYCSFPTLKQFCQALSDKVDKQKGSFAEYAKLKPCSVPLTRIC